MLDNPQLDLFGEAGGTSPLLHGRSEDFTHLRLYGCHTSMLVRSNKAAPPLWVAHHETKQLSLNLRHSANVVVRLVPRTRSTFLGMRATRFFRHTPALQRFASRYQHRGVIFLGDLLRLPAHEVLSALRRPEWIRQLEEELASVGLVLGDRFSWWKRPVPY